MQYYAEKLDREDRFHSKKKQVSSQMQMCIDQCISCRKTCLEAAVYCLQKDWKHDEVDLVSLLLKCYEICHETADAMRFMRAGSALQKYVWRVCAEVCEQCAKCCEQLIDDEQIKVCLNACLRCKDSCLHMAALSS